MHRYLASPSLHMLSVLGMIAMACSSPKNPSNAPVDGGASDATAGGDASADGGISPPPPNAGVTLDTGMNIYLCGVTDDGYVIYRTPTAVKAVPVIGGPPTTLVALNPASAGVAGDVRVFHNYAFIWKDVGHTTFIGTLLVWSHALGTATQLSTTSADSLAAASADSSAILYTSNVAADGNSGSLYGATSATLAAPTLLASNTYLRGDDCDAPWLYFTGTTAPIYAVVGYCTSPVSAAKQAVYSYPTTTWAPHQLATNVMQFAVDQHAVSVGISLSTGQLEIVPVATGAPVLIDSTATLPTGSSNFYQSFLLSPTDDAVIYYTRTGALKTSPTTASAPVTLTATGVKGLDGLAPMGMFVMLHKGVDDDNDFPLKPGLASTAAGGASTALMSTDDGDFVGDVFTTDGSYALYLTDLDEDDDVTAEVGKLEAVATANPTTTIPLGTATASFPFSPTAHTPADLAVSATKVVYTDHYSSPDFTADLYVKDLASPLPAMLMTKSADLSWALSSDHQYLVYVSPAGGSEAADTFMTTLVSVGIP